MARETSEALIIRQMNRIGELTQALEALMQFNLTNGRKDDAWDRPLFVAVKNAAKVLKQAWPTS